MTDLRPLLLSIAYRMLGSYADAEDVVQDAYLRLHRTGRVEHERAFLTTVTTRLAIDHLRSARVRREQYTGPWLPEPVVDEYADLSDHAVLSDSLSTAFLVLLERLSPEQRAVFLLRDVFGYSFDEVAAIVGKTPAACRQLAVRARRQVEDGRPRYDATPGERDELAGRFLAACREGDLGGLVDLLAADVTFTGDGGGKGNGLPRPVHGGDAVARLLRGMFVRFVAHGVRADLVHVGGHPAVWLRHPPGTVPAGQTELIGVWALEIAGGRVTAIRGVVNPDKLGHLRDVTSRP